MSLICRRSACALVAGWIFVACSVRAHADIDTASGLVARDARLSRTFSLCRETARVGEIFDAVKQQTGVDLIAEDRDGAAGEVVSIYVHDLPVAKLMSSLRSLVSYQNAEWRWTLEGSDDGKASQKYRLERTVAAREFPRLLRDEIQRYFLALMEADVNRALAATPDAGDANFPETALFVGDTPAAARMRLGMQAVDALTTPAVRMELATGATDSVTMPRGQWPPAVTAFADEEMALLRATVAAHPDKVPPGWSPPADPQQVTVTVSTTSMGMCPGLYISFNGLGGSAYAGAAQTDSVLAQRIRAAWMLPGDTADDPTAEATACAAALPAPCDLDADMSAVPWDRPDWHRPTEQQTMMQLHALTGLPIVARYGGMPGNAGIDLRAPGTTVGLAIAGLGGRWRPFSAQGLLFKWRDGVLLSTYVAWPRDGAGDEEKRVPWTAVRTFRQQVGARGGIPSLTDIAELSAALTPDQYGALMDGGTLMPRADGSSLGLSAPSLQPILARLYRDPEVLAALQSDRGLLVRTLELPVRDWVSTFLLGPISPTSRLRVQRTQREETLVPSPNLQPDPTTPAGGATTSANPLMQETVTWRLELLNAASSASPGAGDQTWQRAIDIGDVEWDRPLPVPTP